MIKFGHLAEFHLVIWLNIVWSFGNILIDYYLQTTLFYKKCWLHTTLFAKLCWLEATYY